MDLRRRTFLKTAALAMAGSALPGCQKQVDHLIPYLLPDDEIVPGVANWYASTCRECSAGCGTVIRVREGRAKKIEGNPDHPVSQGKLCAKGQASLQGLYNPDRLQGPLAREGNRGEGKFISLDWEESLRRCEEILSDKRASPIMITSPLSGTLHDLLADFVVSLGGQLYQYAPNTELPLYAAWSKSMGADVVPIYDVAHADYLLSFGAPVLEGWLSPVAMGIAFGHMRQGRPSVRGRYIHAEPRMSLSAANADRWLPIRPGTEGLLALGIGKVILDDHRIAFDGEELKRYRDFYGTTQLDEVANATDIPQKVIVGLAQEFASAQAPLAIGGGPACSQTNGTLALIAVHGLNALVGNLGRKTSAGIFLRNGHSKSVQWLTERTVIDLMGEKPQARKPSVLLLYDCNPLFAMPPSVPIKKLFERASSIISFSSFMDESTTWADIVMPDRAALESWGDQITEMPVPAIGLSQPAVEPLYNTRQVGDTVLELSRRLGVGNFRSQTFYDLLRERWKGFLAGKPHEETPDWFEKAWITRLQQGGWWQEPGRTLFPLTFTSSERFESPVFFGAEQEFPFMFYPYPSMTIGYGDGANRPWLQELPDTLTTVVWGSWVELNPSTAKSLGIRQGDVVRISSSFGSLEAAAVLFPGIRPEVIAMSIGQGHSTYGRFAKGRGVNPLTLLAPALDSLTGTLAYGATRVRIERVGPAGRLVMLERPAMEPGDLITIKRSHGL